MPLDYDQPCTGCIGGQFAAAIAGDGAPAWARPGVGPVIGMAPSGLASWTAEFAAGAFIDIATADGKTEWSHRIEGSIAPRSIALGATNGIFVTGVYLDAVDWGPATTRAPGRESAFLVGLSLDAPR